MIGLTFQSSLFHVNLLWKFVLFIYALGKHKSYKEA